MLEFYVQGYINDHLKNMFIIYRFYSVIEIVVQSYWISRRVYFHPISVQNK